MNLLRKLIFTLSSVNAILNTLVIAIFMPEDVIVLYEFNGVAKAHGSKWFYLIYIAIPLIISGFAFLSDKFKKKSLNETVKKETEDDEISGERAFEEMLNGKSRHSDNLCMLLTWFFAIIGWVMTGIALNNIENIGVILPSIIVIMLSAVMMFLTGIYSNASPNSIGGIYLKWLKDDEVTRKKANTFSFYMGVLSGMVGVCLAAWSLVVSNNTPNCLAVILLVVVGLVVGLIIGFFVSRTLMKKYLKKNPPINEKMIETMMSSMGRKPSQKQVKQVMQQMNKMM